MRLLRGAIPALIVFLVFGVSPAFAGFYVWQDPVSRISFSVPDTWKMMPSYNPDDVVTFRAPGQNQHAGCKLRVTGDERFSIFPESVSDHVQNLNFDYNYWERKSEKETRVYRVNHVMQKKGLGNGFATYADISYVPLDGVPTNMRSVIYASLYNNKVYALDCFAENRAFIGWHHVFQYILGSVGFRKEIHELPTGDYRYFLGDRVLEVVGPYGHSSRH